MPQIHEVSAGDCVSSISKSHGFFWETIWNHPENSELKNLRQDPNILLPGDRVYVPDKDPGEENGATEARHRFRLKGVPAKLRLRVMREPKPEGSVPSTPGAGAGEEKNPSSEDPLIEESAEEDEPLANAPYMLKIDGLVVEEGTTDGDGRVEIPLAPDAREGELILNPGTDEERIIPLGLGHLDPIGEVIGVKQRLCNLGFECGELDGEHSEELEVAVRAFQEKHGLGITGEVDQETRDAIKEQHGS